MVYKSGHLGSQYGAAMARGLALMVSPDLTAFMPTAHGWEGAERADIS